MRGWRALPRDAGAAAVEFALVSVLLFTVLFGIMQYGVLLWQLQAANAAAQETAREVARGLSPSTRLVSCGDADVLDFVDTVAEGNGLPDGSVTGVDVDYVPPAGFPVQAMRDAVATVTITVTPTQFNLPYIPVPATLTPRASTLVEIGGACINPISVP